MTSNIILHLAWVWSSTAAAIICILAGLIRGGTAERWGAVILCLSWFSVPFIDNHHGFRMGIFIDDVLTLIAYGVLSAWSRKPWTFFVTVFQLATVVTHIGTLLAWNGDWVYMTVSQIFGAWVIVIATGYGVFTARPRVKRAERQAAWGRSAL